MRHTPGPWKAIIDMGYKTNPCSVVVKRPGVHATTVANIPRRATIPSWEWDANARLIAAAPDLLEALKEMVERWGSNPRADAAIAKAKGE
jgi:hypothetical protein